MFNMRYANVDCVWDMDYVSAEVESPFIIWWFIIVIEVRSGDPASHE